jgi:hypothetical protein
MIDSLAYVDQFAVTEYVGMIDEDEDAYEVLDEISGY